MTTQITVTLPEDILQRAEFLASRSGCPVVELLAETIELSLRQLGKPSNHETGFISWTDEQVLEAATAEMPSGDDQRLSELLDRQQSGLLIETERAELTDLLHLYQHELLRKALALREGVRRRLRPRHSNHDSARIFQNSGGL